MNRARHTAGGPALRAVDGQDTRTNESVLLVVGLVLSSILPILRCPKGQRTASQHLSLDLQFSHSPFLLLAQ
jgi:hypothetical protein